MNPTLTISRRDLPSPATIAKFSRPRDPNNQCAPTWNQKKLRSNTAEYQHDYARHRRARFKAAGLNRRGQLRKCFPTDGMTPEQRRAYWKIRRREITAAWRAKRKLATLNSNPPPKD